MILMKPNYAHLALIALCERDFHYFLNRLRIPLIEKFPYIYLQLTTFEQAAGVRT